MTEGIPNPPQQPGQPAQPPGGYPPPQTPPPATSYPQQQVPQPGAAPQYPQQQVPQPGAAPQYPQQQVPPATGYPQQPQPYQPPKKSNTKKIILILALVIGLPLLGIGACTVFFVGALKGPINESNAMLALLDEGKYQQAYDAFDPTCTSSFTAEDLSSTWTGIEIDGYNLNSVSVVNSNAEVDGTVSLDGGSPEPVHFELNKRDGDWKVCGFTLR